MPLHVRRQIVLAVTDLLRRGVPGVVVHAGRNAPLPVARAPYLLVYARKEQSRSVAAHGEDDRRMQRPLVVAVRIVVADASDSDEQLDAFSLLVEQAMAVSPRLGGLVEDQELVATEFDGSAEGESRLGSARLDFAVEYHTSALRPDQHLE